MDFYLPLLNITNDSNIPSQQDMIKRFSNYFQYFKFWLSNQSINVTSKPLVLTEVGYPSSLAGLALPSGNPTVQCVALDENKEICNGTIIFWWDNPSSMDYYKEKDSNYWRCSWTVRGKPAECTIAEAFDGTCSTNRNVRQ
ncbi:unnamed protein product [Rotaria sp. Silwood1]|nr:unnamed protein product [Rotaria sp. Silwood1]CAF3662208.1 unnamed protein product [Rotaria sp. Silwood1]CAF4595402.1 unnamed protein product [Rotaria sp. Silwood1]CAF4709207.1 unnamed protein product [Rotaria sp. Silwood1]